MHLLMMNSKRKKQ